MVPCHFLNLSILKVGYIELDGELDKKHFLWFLNIMEIIKSSQ